jgi:hypothetical protein
MESIWAHTWTSARAPPNKGGRKWKRKDWNRCAGATYPVVPLEGVAQLGVDLVVFEVVYGEVEFMVAVSPGLAVTLTFPSRLSLAASSSSAASPVRHGAEDSSSFRFLAIVVRWWFVWSGMGMEDEVGGYA